MPFTLGHGGHKPTGLRDEFETLLEAGTLQDSRLHELCGLLWNCDDVIPSSYRFELDQLLEQIGGPPIVTYAQAARRIRQAA